MTDASNDPHTTSSFESEPPDKQGGIGYRKPPKRFQFRKGQTGNPRGRPKNLTLLWQIFAIDGRDWIPESRFQ